MLRPPSAPTASVRAKGMMSDTHGECLGGLHMVRQTDTPARALEVSSTRCSMNNKALPGSKSAK
jgi:hypothetical protein